MGLVELRGGFGLNIEFHQFLIVFGIFGETQSVAISQGGL